MSFDRGTESSFRGMFSKERQKKLQAGVTARVVSEASATSSSSGIDKLTIVSETVLNGSASQNKGIRSTLDPGKVKQFYAHTIAILTNSHSIHSRPKTGNDR